MDSHQKVLFVDATSGFYRLARYPIGDFFGPIDLGLHLSGRYSSLNFGVGLLAGSIFPGSNRLFFTGFSQAWGGFYVSSIGGAGLVFDNLGINLVALVGKAMVPSILYLNRVHGEEIEVRFEPVDLRAVWEQGRGGIYGLLDHTFARFGSSYSTESPDSGRRPATPATNSALIGSVPIDDRKLSTVDTWAGRGGWGASCWRHGIAAVISEGAFVDDDFRDRTVADQRFKDKYQKKMLTKDVEATVKSRTIHGLNTGSTSA